MLVDVTYKPKTHLPSQQKGQLRQLQGSTGSAQDHTYRAAFGLHAQSSR